MKQLFEFAGYPVPEQVKLFRITDDLSIAACHVYMEAQIFAPDSRFFIFHQSAHPHGSDPADQQHRYLLCDLRENGKVTPLTSECGVTAPALSPDGRYFYYFVDDLDRDGSLRLMRIDLQNHFEKTELCRLTQDSMYPPSAPFYPLSTISSDGRHIAISTGIRKKPGEEWNEYALRVFDTETGESTVPLHGLEYCNLHLQYSRDPAAPRTILIQHNHGSRLTCENGVRKGISHVAALDAASNFTLRRDKKQFDPQKEHTGFGLDLHIIEDDGTFWRSLPAGRNGVEFCQGHHCWRGKSAQVITSTLLFHANGTVTQELIEMDAFAGEQHLNNADSLQGSRNILSRDIVPPHFLHFATDDAGKLIVSDYEADNGEWHLYTGTLGNPGDAAKMKFILNLGSREKSPWHPHPFLSPDGKYAFFNSSAEGILQPYMVVLE